MIIFLYCLADGCTAVPNARDTWIQANQNRSDGANPCTLWNAFASRGLGMNAANHVGDPSSKWMLNRLAILATFYEFKHRLSLPYPRETLYFVVRPIAEPAVS